VLCVQLSEQVSRGSDLPHELLGLPTGQDWHGSNMGGTTGDINVVAGAGPLILSGSRLAASASAGRLGPRLARPLLRGLVASDGWLTMYVRRRLSSAVGPVEVGVEADQRQVVLFRRDVLVGIVEVESEAPRRPGDGCHVRWSKPEQPNLPGDKHVISELDEPVRQFLSQHVDADRVEREFGNAHRARCSEKEFLYFISLCLVKEILEQDARIE
jgi:hypothetical protein